MRAKFRLPLALVVYKRELRQYATSPGTYVTLAFFFLLSGAFFTLLVGAFVEASVQAQQGARQADAVPLNVTDQVVTQMFQVINFLMLVVVPMLTMRLLTEEKRAGTFELLLSTPLGSWDILLGKYLAALTVGAGILAVCVVYPLICSIYSDPEWPVVWSSFLGLFLIVAAYTAFGLFASSLSESQVAAASVSFVGLLIFQMVHLIFKAGRLGLGASALSVYRHADGFTRGMVGSSDVLFFVLFSTFFLFLSAQILDAGRWRT